MKYEIGKTVDFNWEYYCNTDLQYEGTERLTGKIESYNEETGNYSIDVNGTLYTVKEDEIIDNAAEFKHKLIDKKIEIANAALKMRDALWGMDHPAHRKECSEEYDKYREKIYNLMFEYDDLEDKYIMLGGEKETY